MKTKNQLTNRILSLVLALVMILSMLPASTLAASANDAAVASGTCGTNVQWALTGSEAEGYTLTISGTGAMAGYSDFEDQPWYNYASNITAIVVNEGITSVGERAFFLLKQVTTAQLPDSLTTISISAFQTCMALKTVNFPTGLKTIGVKAFAYCNALESVTLPEGLTTIGLNAFEGCENLTSVTVPASVTAIGNKAFYLSPAKIIVADENSNYSSDAYGVLFNKGKTTLIHCPANIEAETYTIPDTVTEIYELAFSECTALKSITIPESVTNIGASAFLGCTALTTITIPASVTSIGSEAFSFCTALTTVNVPCTWDGSLYTFEDGVEVNKVHTPDADGYTDNGNGKHSFTCTVCSTTFAEDHTTTAQATCSSKAICELCGEYGEKNANNHTGTLGTPVHTADGSQHVMTYDCCNTTVTEAHTAEPAYAPNAGDSTKHDVTYSCCGATVTEDHSFTDGKCISCSYECAHETYTDSVCDLCGEACNHDYTNGICNDCGGYQPATLITADNRADFDFTDDTYDGYYAISNVGQLIWYGTNNGSNAVLVSDIQIGTAEEPWVEWGSVEIGSIFDGNGHTVDMHLTYSSVNGEADGRAVGLLSANYKTVRNLILTGSITCNSTYRVGAVSHSGYASVFENIISYVDITNQSTAPTGGIVGYYGNNGDGSTMTNCAVYANISGENYVGGLVGQGWAGWQYWTLTNCAFYGSVTGAEGKTGALVGYSSTDNGASKVAINNCYYLNGLSAVGGFAGTIGTNDSHTKTAEQFANGEVTWLLNGESADGVWKQTLDTDDYPVFNGEKVYKNQIGGCCEENYVYGYANTENDPVTTHIYDENGECACGDLNYFVIGKLSSQIRFGTNEDGSYAHTFDIRTRAKISDADFIRFVGETNDIAVINIKKAGFVYSINPDTFTIENAKLVAKGDEVTGYTDAPVNYIQDADGYYTFTCIVTDIPDSEIAQTLISFAYICVEIDGVEYWYFMSEQAEADFNSLYTTYIPLACNAYGWESFSAYVDNGDGTHSRACAVCGEVESGEHTEEYTYTWAEDYTTCTATAVCTGCGSEVTVQTVDAVYAVTTSSTCTVKGTGTYTATFTAAGLTAQTKEVELPTDPDAHSFDENNTCSCGEVLIQIEFTDFELPYGDSWNTEVNLDGSTGTIGTADEGYTDWANGDQIFVTLTSKYSGTQTAVIIYNNGWDGNVSFSYLKSEIPTVSAIYAPCYEVTEEGVMQFRSGMRLGMTEYLVGEAKIDELSGRILNNIFTNATRTYSRLRIVGLANQTLTVTTTGFTPAGATSEATEAYTLTTDDNGNAYLYGTFAVDATVSVKYGAVTLAEFTFSEENGYPNGTEQGKSYALDARPIIDGTLGGKATAEESDITALVEKLKYYVDNGITTITVTGSNPAMITVNNVSMTAIGEAIYRLSGSGTYDADNPYNGKIDLILPDVTEIVDYEFYKAYALNSITLPNVTKLGDSAFYDCQYLKKITFGSVVKEGSPKADDFQYVGTAVGLCDLVLNKGQVNAATEYIPDPVGKIWWAGTKWKYIELI